MKKLGFIYLAFLIFTFNCKSKEEIAFTDEVQKSALNVPVGKVGVIISIDSLESFKHKNDSEFIYLNSIDTIISNLQTKLPIQKIVADKTFKILNDHNYNFKIIKDYNKEHFPKEDFFNENKPSIDFISLKKNYNFDDLLLIKVKVGLDQDSTKTDEVIAKTYISINILDLNNKNVKYSESIGGSKYFNKTNNNFKLKDAKTLIYESLDETLDIIDNKY